MIVKEIQGGKYLLLLETNKQNFAETPPKEGGGGEYHWTFLANELVEDIKMFVPNFKKIFEKTAISRAHMQATLCKIHKNVKCRKF